ncbi:circularly permuted type 2 ATP-grasp protein [Blastococcus jejuensis]|uniref:Circularly permuted type 2 ATP-grasp protein n=1 Tax=Blastococcus jejuensis TaxID=351224 RepID=A0ABP6PGN3_9ACTN
MSPDLLADYPAAVADEAVEPGGRLRPAYAPLGPVLHRLGTAGLAEAAAALEAERSRRGVSLSAWSDGRQHPQPFRQDPWPRVVPLAEWTLLAAGVEQRHRALTAFLADAYRAAGRRRGDPDRDPDVVRAGVLPPWAVAHSPGRTPEAVGLAWPGQARAGIAAADVVRTSDGRWVVVRDELRAPAGLGFALAGRDVARAAVPGLCPAEDSGVVDPRAALPVLQAGLAAGAPPECAGPPTVAVLTAGQTDGAYAEHAILAEALGVPLVRAGDVWPRADGGVELAVRGERVPVDVLYRRFDDAALGAYRTPIGQALDSVLAEAVRAGRLGLVNVPGNGVADDVTTFAFVPAMIRFYLGEDPLLDSVRTWLLADPDQWAQVRDRLDELVVEPAEGYGGSGTVAGPTASATELAQLYAEVAAAPHRFVAREAVDSTTVPTLVDGVLRPRHVDLRVFSVATPEPRVLPAPLTRVAAQAGSTETAAAQGGGTKDTWLLGELRPPGSPAGR